MHEVGKMLSVKVLVSSNELERCRCMLVYLNGQTWTSGEASERFADDVTRAMDAGIPLLLAHEMPSGAPRVEGRRHARAPRQRYMDRAPMGARRSSRAHPPDAERRESTPSRHGGFIALSSLRRARLWRPVLADVC